jgi:hypothetical protein
VRVELDFVSSVEGTIDVHLDLARRHDDVARLIPLTLDGVIYRSWMMTLGARCAGP